MHKVLLRLPVQQKEGGIRVGLFARTDSLRKHSHLFLKRTLEVK